ncbi:prolyl 4-hydroxylase subunit alpha-3 [Eublepharis macularius]|uniref:Prolyl 4-hydroxylase subunit alpha-3 n=1 Tax=Eublepharis macularius TaxID=481883 RepID=A0AA97J357_EUBMA|nr:prolyl 4-hydroxylase subunit alpha-3 [Eublepharis macularius]
MALKTAGLPQLQDERKSPAPSPGERSGLRQDSSLWVRMMSWFVGVALLGLLQGLEAETFTSMLSIHQALATERELLQYLHTYLEEETSRLKDLQRFYTKIQTLHQGVGSTVVNPLLAYTLIKRLQSDWLNVVYSMEASENSQALKDGYQRLENSLPAFEDLEGAARAVMRLQDVYSLSVKGLAQGKFQRVSNAPIPDLYSSGQDFSLSADDCFHIGKVAYDMEDHYHSIAWLEEAVNLFRVSYGNWNTEDEGSLEDALDHLAFSYFKAGNISHALSLSQEFLHYDPSNKRIARNVLKYEKLLMESSESGKEAPALQRPNVTHLKTRDIYEQLCQTLGSQPTQYQEAGLYCSYEANGDPRLILQPLQREIVHLRPYIALYHDFVSDSEAKKIKALAAPWLQRSAVASGERQQKAEYRISKSAWLKETVDPLLVSLDWRIAALTGLNIRHPYAEYLQVVNYGLGGHYEPHFDHATSRKSPLYRLKSGNRIATVMVYLSSVEAGGSTAFIYANFSIPVVKNAALFWWNLHRNGEGNGDTLHAGCPVLAGDKWVANKWIHEYGQEFRRPCSTNPED